MKHWLYTEQGRVYLWENYVVKKRSTYEISEELKTYANKIRRALLHHGIPLREKGEAMGVAQNKGRHENPTRGRTRTEEERDNIRKGRRKNGGRDGRNCG